MDSRLRPMAATSEVSACSRGASSASAVPSGSHHAMALHRMDASAETARCGLIPEIKVVNSKLY